MPAHTDDREEPVSTDASWNYYSGKQVEFAHFERDGD